MKITILFPNPGADVTVLRYIPGAESLLWKYVLTYILFLNPLVHPALNTAAKNYFRSARCLPLLKRCQQETTQGISKFLQTCTPA